MYARRGSYALTSTSRPSLSLSSPQGPRLPFSKTFLWPSSFDHDSTLLGSFLLGCCNRRESGWLTATR